MPDDALRSASAGDLAAELLDPAVAGRLKRDANGLVAAVVQDHTTEAVLMVGYMDDEALRRTLTTGHATYWSRSRGEYWVKGETSGHVQHVREVRMDCDGDALLVRVDQVGPACHTGAQSCFDEGALPVTGVNQPGTDEPGADEPEADEPEADEPEADEPEADEPEADG